MCKTVTNKITNLSCLVRAFCMCIFLVVCRNSDLTYPCHRKSRGYQHMYICSFMSFSLVYRFVLAFLLNIFINFFLNFFFLILAVEDLRGVSVFIAAPLKVTPPLSLTSGREGRSGFGLIRSAHLLPEEFYCDRIWINLMRIKALY